MTNFTAVEQEQDAHGGKWLAVGDVNFYTKLWTAKGQVKATVTFIHGIGDHILRYDHVFNQFAQKGITTFSYDQRGFGRTALAQPSTKEAQSQVRSRPVLGDCGDWATWQDDIDRAVKGEGIENFRQDGVPHFLMGHSMGGLLVICYALEHPEANLSGVISSAPAIRPGFHVPYLKRAIGSFAANFLPTVNIPTELDVTGLSRDESVVKDYNSDPYVHGYGSLRTLSTVLSKGEECLGEEYASKWQEQLPLFVPFGSADRLTSHASGKVFVDQLKCKDKTFKSYDGWYHELHNEPEKELVIKDFTDWILQHAHK